MILATVTGCQEPPRGASISRRFNSSAIAPQGQRALLRVDVGELITERFGPRAGIIGAFRFGPLEAVIVNKAMSLIVVISALPFRTGTTSVAAIAGQWPIIVNLLAGSLLGAWIGASWATRLKSETLYRVIPVLLVAIAAILLVGHGAEGAGHAVLTGPAQMVAGVIAGFAIGVVASLMGVAGGELLISHPHSAVRRGRQAGW